MKVTLRQHGQPDETFEVFAFDHIESTILDSAGDEAGHVSVHVLPGNDLDVYISMPAPDDDVELRTAEGRVLRFSRGRSTP